MHASPLSSSCNVVCNEANECRGSFPDTGPIILVLANVRSICNKLGALKAFLDHYKPDILAVTESWGRPCLLDSFVSQPGYVLFRQDRRNGSGGGVFILVKESLSPLPYSCTCTISIDDPVLTFEDSVWCTISIPPNKSALIGCMYRSPLSTSSNDEILKTLFNQSIDAPFEFCILVGDFNCPNIDWDNLSSTPAYQFLLDSCLDNYLTQIIAEPTRDKNILDLIFINDTTVISSVDIKENFPGSDHHTVFCSLDFGVQRPSVKTKL